jgi:hypothetical protein
MNMGKLEGKTALITGGSSGIGLATAKWFVDEGAYVFITERRQGELETAVGQIGQNVTAVQSDVSKMADLDKLYAAVKKQKGKLDIVFANGGTGSFAPLGQIGKEHFDKQFGVNVKGLSGPVYGPPMIHRISREATFIFDFPAAWNGQKESSVKASGSTSLFREDFSQLLKTVVNTYWPTVVQDEKCQNPDATEAYSGPQCTGTFLEAPGLPGNYAANAEDIGVSQDFNSIVGNHLNILVHLRLTPSSQSATAVNGN